MDNLDIHTFRDRLKILTNDAGGTKKFSASTGIPYASLIKYLVKTDPTRAVLMKIITNLNVNPTWLLTGVGGKYITLEEGSNSAPADFRDNKLSPPSTESFNEDNYLHLPIYSHKFYNSHKMPYYDGNDLKRTDEHLEKAIPRDQTFPIQKKILPEKYIENPKSLFLMPASEMATMEAFSQMTYFGVCTDINTPSGRPFHGDLLIVSHLTLPYVMRLDYDENGRLMLYDLNKTNPIPPLPFSTFSQTNDIFGKIFIIFEVKR